MQKSGFDSPTYLHGMTEIQLNKLEGNINQNRSILENIETGSLGECSHIEHYTRIENFKFLPGHRFLIMKASKIPPPIDENQAFEHPAFSTLFQSLIKCALKNYEKLPTSYRYSNLIKDFAIYIYIMAGKACYEVVAANLPLPSASAICNYIFKLRSTHIEYFALNSHENILNNEYFYLKNTENLNILHYAN